MKVIVDANIVFSAILNTNSKIADLLLNSKGSFTFFAPDFLQTELRKYYSKISKISKLSVGEIERIENKVTKAIVFMSVIHIPESKWIIAENMVLDIDGRILHMWHFLCFINVRSGLEIKFLEQDWKIKDIKT